MKLNTVSGVRKELLRNLAAASLESLHCPSVVSKQWIQLSLV